MPTLPNLNSLGKLCSSSRSQNVDRVRVKRKSSVKRMSIIEDGHVAEVLYLIPKQYMEQMPYLNPNDYYLSERLNDVATGRTPESFVIVLSLAAIEPNFGRLEPSGSKKPCQALFEMQSCIVCLQTKVVVLLYLYCCLAHCDLVFPLVA